MKDYGLVSIITPTWNCGRYISKTIDSVMAQTYPNWEMIIIDDCSTDGTNNVVNYYNDNRIKYHCLEKNSGAAIARNTALRMAKGRWIAFLDSDDLWEPEKLERQIKFMIDNDYHFSCTERDVIDEQSRPTGKYISGPQKISRLGMLCYCWPGCLTVMYDRDKVGLIQIKDIKKNNDYAIWLEVIKHVNCYLLMECLAHYRIRKGSISRHSKLSLIKWHYKLFHETQDMSALKSIFFVCINLVSGVLKQILYVKEREK